jgi:glucose-1-phosphate adenylyltransferase
LKTRAVILAGGEGSRLSVLTAKRTKPAVPFAGKYRIIDFTLSNCVNSEIFDVMVLVQYRPHSLIEHIGAGGPWDLNRDFTGGIRMYTPYKARFGSDWYLGTADAVQQNFVFIKQSKPDNVLILSGDHVYAMDYDPLITFHRDHSADLTMATIRVPMDEASRYGIVGVDNDYRVKSFIEKPSTPSSDLANMGVYLFKMDVLDQYLWKDHADIESSHDFGKDLLPRMVNEGRRVYAYPYSGYWVDVGTTQSYWKAHMDLLGKEPPLKLNDRSWVIHTRTEERPPVRIEAGASALDSMLSDGCILEAGARVEMCVLSPGVIVRAGADVRQSIILTDVIIESGAKVERAILDKRVHVGDNATIGSITDEKIVLVGKNSQIPNGAIIHPGATIASDVVISDYFDLNVGSEEIIETQRKPNEY